MSLAFGRRFGGRGRHQRVHELQRRFRSLRHLVFQLPRRIVRIAEQLGFLCAQLSQAGDGVAGVVGSAALGAIPGILKERLPRRALGERGRSGCCVVFCKRNDLALLALRSLAACAAAASRASLKPASAFLSVVT